MTEKQLFVFELAKMFFILLEVFSRIAWVKGVGPAWLARNLARFTTLLFGVSLVIEHSYRFGNGLCFVTGLLVWNRPKDGDGPKRKRRKQEQKEEDRSPNWTGIPEAA